MGKAGNEHGVGMTSFPGQKDRVTRPTLELREKMVKERKVEYIQTLDSIAKKV